jgi:hypothetical protein
LAWAAIGWGRSFHLKRNIKERKDKRGGWQVIGLFGCVMSNNATTGTGAGKRCKVECVPVVEGTLAFQEQKAMHFYGQSPGSLPCQHANTRLLGYLIWALGPTKELDSIVGNFPSPLLNTVIPSPLVCKLTAALISSLLLSTPYKIKSLYKFTLLF